MIEVDPHSNFRIIPPSEELHHWHLGRAKRPRRKVSSAVATLAAVAVFTGAFTGSLYFPASALAAQMRPLIAEIGEAAHQLANRSTALSTEYAQRASAALANIHIASGIEFAPHLQLAQAAAAETAGSFMLYVGSLWRQLFGTFAEIGTTQVYVRTPDAAMPRVVTSTTTPRRTVAATPPTPVQQTIINQPVIERIVSVPAAPGISQSSLATQLQSLRDDLINRIAGIAVPSYPPQLAPATFQALALSQRIDELSGTTITDPAITGGTISGTHISADSFSLSGALSLASAIFDSLTATTLTATNATTTRLDALEYVAVGGSATTTIRGDGVASVLPYASSTALTVSGTASTSNLIASTGFTFKTVTGFLKATAGIVSEALVDLAANVTGILPVANGGTGWAAIQSGTVPYGNGSSALATSSALAFDGTKLIAAYASTTALTSSGSAYFATSGGNVGIGTTRPTNALTVIGAMHATYPDLIGQLEIDSSEPMAIDKGGVLSFGGNYTGTTETEFASIYGRKENATAGDPSGYIGFLTRGPTATGAERMRITSTGNVGIGTTTPWGKLSVTNTGTGPSFIVEDSTSPDTTPFIVDATGNVGIGTTTPGTKLDVYGGNIRQDNGTYNLAISNGSTLTGSNHMILNASGTYLQMQAAGNIIMTQNSVIPFTSEASGAVANTLYLKQGNVGIGTTTPWRKLSVTGTVGFDGLTGTTGAGSLCLDANKQVVYNSGSDSCLSSTRITKHDITDLVLSGINTVAALRSVSFIYNNDASSTVRYGFIAEDTAAVDPHFATYDAQGNVSGVDDRSLISILVKAVQELIAKVVALADTVAGFAESFTTKRLCIERSDGTPVCVTGDQLASVLSGAPSPQGSDPTPPATSDTTTTPPSIHIAGENPATIHVGDTYADLGAIATDSQGHELSYRAFINGVLSGDILIDTSHEATDTIDYVATDTWGNTATSTRTVIVEGIVPPVTATDTITSATGTATSSPSGQ